LEVVREFREHAGKLARGFARGDQRAVEIREDMWKRAERLGDRVARDHLAAQRGEHLAHALALGLLDERVERLLDREPRLEEGREPARHLRELGSGDGYAREARSAGRIVGGDDLDAIRREALVAQRRA